MVWLWMLRISCVQHLSEQSMQRTGFYLSFKFSFFFFALFFFYVFIGWWKSAWPIPLPSSNRPKSKWEGFFRNQCQKESCESASACLDLRVGTFFFPFLKEEDDHFLLRRTWTVCRLLQIEPSELCSLLYNMQFYLVVDV